MKTVLLSILLTTTSTLYAQHDESFIYGRVVTTDDRSYTGCLRWNKEEVFWVDYFNSVKTENKYHKYVSKEDLLTNIQQWFAVEKKKERIGEDSEGTINKEETHHSVEKDLVHVWICAFGDLRSLKVTGTETADLELKDGTIIKVKGGSNDLGNTVKVLDKDVGEISLNWDRISYIEFMKTPDKLSHKFGMPLYGTVKTTSAEFTGFLQWDQEERLNTDLLDGKTEDGNLSVEFGKIRSITKKDEGSLVKLISGREIFLKGSNDVNNKNRGININIENLGRVTVPWSNFEEVIFTDPGEHVQPKYSDFSKPDKIKGKVVTTNGRAFKGVIAYDLDEEYDFELIQGNDNGIEYAIPAKNIERITPLNNKCRITPKKGRPVSIGGTHDVAEYNSGVLIFTESQNEPVYLKWAVVKEISLQ